MHIPKGFHIEGHDTNDYVLQIHRNIYGQKQAGRVWNMYFVDKLINKLGFRQSKVDKCVFYCGTKCTYCIPTIRFWQVRTNPRSIP